MQTDREPTPPHHDPDAPVNPRPAPQALIDLARTAGVRQIADLSSHAPADRFVQKIPITFARQHGLLGLAGGSDEGDASPANAPMPLAMSDLRERDLAQADVVGRYLNVAVEPVLAPAAQVLAAIDAAYATGGKSEETQVLLEGLARREVLDEVRQLQGREDLLDGSGRAPVIKLVNLILFEAIKSRASDVHVQPSEDALSVRMRIDGVLYDAFDVPKAVQEEVVSRLKVMGRMNIAEKRLAQDGRATVRVGDRVIDLRLATLPTSFGERAVIRLLDKSARLYRLGELGMEPASLERFRQLIGIEHGILLVTGPTGSGKTTTLYAALQEIDATQRNILTLEDPIEYGLDGISQTQVSEKKGMTFASGLRSVLRQDPDVIMVGEIRDRETAVMAIQSALTGHLVFSTLHTNDAASAVARLLDLGIEPYLLASSLVGVLAQRLVRQVCRDCARPAVPSAEDVRRLGRELPDVDASRLRVGGGCESCRDTGYLGRRGIFELLVVDEPVRREIQRRAAATDIRASAVACGMRTLRDDGLAKFAAGQTTLAEVLRVTV